MWKSDYQIHEREKLHQKQHQYKVCESFSIAGSLGDPNTPRKSKEGAPTQGDVTEAKTFRSAPFSNTTVTLVTNTRNK